VLRTPVGVVSGDKGHGLVLVVGALSAARVPAGTFDRRVVRCQRRVAEIAQTQQCPRDCRISMCDARSHVVSELHDWRINPNVMLSG
jgi:hypothetical protein